MEWNVKNAQSRDVERQHLNKILKEIEKKISTVSGDSLTEADIVRIVEGIVRQNRPNALTRVNVTLTGDATGSGTTDAAGNITIDVAIDPTADGMEEAPMDGSYYWRIAGQWSAVDPIITNLITLEDSGIVVYDIDAQAYRGIEIEGTVDEIDVTDGDGVDANPVISLADLANTGVGVAPIKIYTRDAKGRIEGDEDADTDDLPEGTTNRYFSDTRVYEKMKDVLVAGANITLVSDDIDEEITITATGGGGGGGGVDTVTGGAGISVDNTDAANPIVSVSTAIQNGVALVTMTAAETIHNNRAVSVGDGDIWHPLLADVDDSRVVLGITRQAGGLGDPILVQTAGPVTNGGWSWVEGPVYSDDSGVLTQTAPSTGWIVCVGIATSATTIDVRVSRPILRS